MKYVFLVILVLPFLLNAQLRLDADNHLSLNHAGGQIGDGVFTISSSNDGWGGMYMNVTGNNAKPFYGYAVDGAYRAFTGYNESSSQLVTYVDGVKALKLHKDSTSISTYLDVYNNANIGSSLTIGGDGEPFNQYTHFTINSRTGTYGGMYVNSEHAGGSEKPFYGYAVDGMVRAFSYFDKEEDYWKLNLGNWDILKVSNLKVLVRGYIQLHASNSAEEGSIYYRNGHFYGFTSTGERQLDNAAAARGNANTSEEVESLRMEVQKLRAELDQLKEIAKKLK